MRETDERQLGCSAKPAIRVLGEDRNRIGVLVPERFDDQLPEGKLWLFRSTRTFEGDGADRLERREFLVNVLHIAIDESGGLMYARGSFRSNYPQQTIGPIVEDLGELSLVGERDRRGPPDGTAPLQSIDTLLVRASRGRPWARWLR